MAGERRTHLPAMKRIPRLRDHAGPAVAGPKPHYGNEGKRSRRGTEPGRVRAWHLVSRSGEVVFLKSDSAARRVGWRRIHQLADGVKDDFKLRVVFPFHRSFRARSACVESSSRRRTKARIMAMFTCTARVPRKTLESMATPCSVKAIGTPPPNFPRPGITFCDTSASISSSFSVNMKSSGNRSRFAANGLLESARLDSV